MRQWLLTLALAAFAAVSSARAEVGRQAFTVKLGDFTSRGEITYPTSGTAPFPTVLLIHGSTPMDLNASIQEGTKMHSQIFAQLAETLAARGIAVVRYNKRYVTAAGQADTARYYDLKLQDFAADAKTVLEYARTQPLVDARKLFVYGWSEGSAIAGGIVLGDAGLRGLIVQGPVAYSYAATFQAQFPRVGLPYLSRYAVNGKLDLKGVLAALGGDGGLLARSQALYMLDPTADPKAPRLSPYLDQNNDGFVDLEREAKPVMAYVFQDSPQFLGLYSSAEALPGLIALAPRLKLPTLILQGENDANIAPEGARDLNAALTDNPDHSLKLYPGLGHSLGVAKDVPDDDFRPMAAQPLEDLAAWIEARSK